MYYKKQKLGVQMKKKPEYLKLFLSFLKIGAFTFGGGYAMIPLIQRETVETHHWVTSDDVLDMLAIAESTPGVIAINSATFIGYRVAGFWGALCATIGVTLPSFVIIGILSMFIMQYKNFTALAWVFDGIRAGVVVLILGAVLKLGAQCPKSNFSTVLMLISFLCAAFFGVDVILILVAAAAAGIVRQLLLLRGRDGTND